jgi:hypothetical protein
MRALLLAAVIAMPMTVLANPNDAPECSGVFPALGIIQFGNDPQFTFYVDDRGYADHGIHLYQESNGVFDPDADPIFNLQRGGQSDTLLPQDSEICSDDDPAGPNYNIDNYYA